MLLSQERMMNLDLRRSAELLRVLAHPTRLAILGALKDGLKCVSDINELLDVSQPNLSQHLAVLRRERIVDFYEKGKQRCYYITRPSMVQALILFLAESIRSSFLLASLRVASQRTEQRLRRAIKAQNESV
jgi:ArsR family transcriptional regulator